MVASTTVVIIIGFIIYVGLYFTYGKKIERDVVRASDDIQTPAHRLYDGVDYIPAHKSVLFGHHFSSIAGAGPLVGPAMAICWGWLPGLLWVWFGNVLIGSVHDYLALMASVRYDGKSVQFVAKDLISKRTGTAFYWIVFFLLILVVAAFANIIGMMFVNTPAISAASVYMCFAAIILGILIYRVKMNLPAATVIGIVMMAVTIWLGTEFPVTASYEVWMVVLFVYIIIAAAIPVNILLQPRDYMNSFLLYFGIFIGFIAAVFTFRGFEIPMVLVFADSAGRKGDALLARDPARHRLRVAVGLPFACRIGDLIQTAFQGERRPVRGLRRHVYGGVPLDDDHLRHRRLRLHGHPERPRRPGRGGQVRLALTLDNWGDSTRRPRRP